METEAGARLMDEPSGGDGGGQDGARQAQWTGMNETAGSASPAGAPKLTGSAPGGRTNRLIAAPPPPPTRLDWNVPTDERSNLAPDSKQQANNATQPAPTRNKEGAGPTRPPKAQIKALKLSQMPAPPRGPAARGVAVGQAEGVAGPALPAGLEAELARQLVQQLDAKSPLGRALNKQLSDFYGEPVRIRVRPLGREA